MTTPSPLQRTAAPPAVQNPADALRLLADQIAAEPATASLHARMEALRRPIEPHEIDWKPKGLSCDACSEAPNKHCRNHRRGRCDRCGFWGSEAHTCLAYAGHAAVTIRLLACDPAWDWEPLGRTPEGLPALDPATNGLWISLTVLGVSKKGFGHHPGNRRMTGGDRMKAMISDAIKNAAMRFGVGIELWSKKFEPPTITVTAEPDENDDPWMSPHPARVWTPRRSERSM